MVRHGVPAAEHRDEQAADHRPRARRPDPFYDDSSPRTRAEQTIRFRPIRHRPAHDTGDLQVSPPVSDSGLPVSLAASGACRIPGTTVHVTGPGPCTITASQAGDGVFEPAQVRRTFTIHRSHRGKRGGSHAFG